MLEEKFVELKRRVAKALEDEASYCTVNYIADKIGADREEVFDALFELADDDICYKEYIPVFALASNHKGYRSQVKAKGLGSSVETCYI